MNTQKAFILGSSEMLKLVMLANPTNYGVWGGGGGQVLKLQLAVSVCVIQNNRKIDLLKKIYYENQ